MKTSQVSRSACEVWPGSKGTLRVARHRDGRHRKFCLLDGVARAGAGGYNLGALVKGGRVRLAGGK